jgi:hypothetical protein
LIGGDTGKQNRGPGITQSNVPIYIPFAHTLINLYRRRTEMKKLGIFAMIVVLMGLMAPIKHAFADGGFNEFGYNYQARIFVGLADGVDKVLDGMVWGDPNYANDHLVMKWNAAWDACNAAGNDTEAACAGAWTDNEWNGAVPSGSGEVWHYKIIWVGSAGVSSSYWAPGGYLVWGNYEVIMDQGTTDLTGHSWFAHATPNGYGR